MKSYLGHYFEFRFQVVLCQAAEIDNTHYYDPTDGSVFLVNHLTLVMRNRVFCDSRLTGLIRRHLLMTQLNQLKKVIMTS
jgi:hypothetical protein